MKQELAVVKKREEWMEERKREEEIFFFSRSLCGNETLQKADRMTDSAREQKRTAAGRETRMTKAERKRRKDNSRQKDLQERDSCCSTPQNAKKKIKKMHKH